MKFFKIHNNENLDVTPHFTERTGRAPTNNYSAYFEKYRYPFDISDIDLDLFSGDLRDSIEEEITDRVITGTPYSIITNSPIVNKGYNSQYISEQSDENWLARMDYIYPENGWRCERINNHILQKKINNETLLYISCRYLIYPRGSIESTNGELISHNGYIINEGISYFVNTISVFNLKQFTENDQEFNVPSFFNDPEQPLDNLEKQIIREFQTIRPLQRLAFRTIMDFRVDEVQELDEYFENMMSNMDPVRADPIYDKITIDGLPFESIFTGQYNKIVSTFSNPDGADIEGVYVPKKVTSFQNTIVYDIKDLDPTDPDTYTTPFYGNPNGEFYNGKYHAVGPFPQLAYKYPRYFWGDLNGKFGNYIVNDNAGIQNSRERLRFEDFNDLVNKGNEGNSEFTFVFGNVIQGAMPSYYDEDYKTIHTEEYLKQLAHESEWYNIYDNSYSGLIPLGYCWYSNICRDLLTEEIIGIKSIDTDNDSYLFLSVANRPHFEYTSGSIIAEPIHYALEVDWEPSGENKTHQVHTAFRFVRNVDNQDKDPSDVIVKLQRSGPYDSVRPQMLPDAIYRLKLLDNGLIDTASLVNIHSQSMDIEIDFEQSKIPNVHKYQQENGLGVTQQSSFGVLSHLIVDDPYFALRYMDGVKFEFDHTFLNSASLFFGCRFLYNTYLDNQELYNGLAEDSGIIVLNPKNGTNYGNSYYSSGIQFFNWKGFNPHYLMDSELWPENSSGCGNIPTQPNTGWYSYREQLVSKKYGSPYLAFEVVK